jgi:hypothetical protein
MNRHLLPSRMKRTLGPNLPFGAFGVPNMYVTILYMIFMYNIFGLYPKIPKP